jgi:hypothetical protein
MRSKYVFPKPSLLSQEPLGHRQACYEAISTGGQVRRRVIETSGSLRMTGAVFQDKVLSLNLSLSR